MLNRQYYQQHPLNRTKLFGENFKKFSSCLARYLKLKTCFAKHQLLILVHPNFFLLGIRFVSSFQEESQLLANCDWEDSMFACNHLLGVSAKHIQKPKALHHAIIHSGSSFRTSICLTCWIRGCVSTSPI